MKQTQMKAALLGILGSAIVACGAHAAEVAVKIGHGRVEPAQITIAKGDTVTFINEDEMHGGHAIIADDGVFRSPGLKKGAAWSYVFVKSGTFSFHIKEHTEAKGKIRVE